jgi:SAM-dependent methyltransferase
MTAPLPPFPLANRVGGLSVKNPMEAYVALGAAIRREIERLLPEDWTWAGKRSLDFGCGAGRAMRHFLDETPAAEFEGCDIDAPSIEWLNEHLAPMHAVVCGEGPGLPYEDESFDFAWATSVFTHLTDYWSGWLLEIHRLLKPGGYLLATFLGEGMSEAITHEPWIEDRVGMLVTRYGASFDAGGPNVLMSPWWLRARWGRAFDIVELEPSGFMGAPGEGHGCVVARKLPLKVTVSDFERPETDEPREWAGLLHQQRHLFDELAATRKSSRWAVVSPPPVARGAYEDLPADVREVLEIVPDLIAENQDLLARTQTLEKDVKRLSGG